MNPDLRRALTILRWVFGLVIIWLSVATLRNLAAGSSGAHAPLASIVRVLAAVEIAGAALLLLPWTRRPGAWILLAVFVAAIAVHGLHGNWSVGPLVVYAAVTWVLLADRPSPAAVV